MAHGSWGPGWPSCSSSKIVTVTSNGLRLPVRRELSKLVSGLVAELAKARGKPFRADWSWGFACRSISGTSSPSNHSWGLAIDLDAPENPYMTPEQHHASHPLRKKFNNGKTLRSSMPKDASAIASKYGFRWGGDYTTKPDPMHFEFMGSVADAERLTQKLFPPDFDYVVNGQRFEHLNHAVRRIEKDLGNGKRVRARRVRGRRK